MTPLEKAMLIAALALLAWGLVFLLAWDVVFPLLRFARGMVWWVYGHGGPPA